LLNAGNDIQRWWRLVYTVLTGMVELLLLIDRPIVTMEHC